MGIDDVNELAESTFKENVELFKKFINYDTSVDNNAHHKKYLISPNRISPTSYVLSKSEFDSLQNIANTINEVVPALIRAWHFNNSSQDQGKIGERLRSIIKLPEKIENLLLENSSNINNCKVFGTLRPDFVIYERNKFKICEINARFSLNGFLLSSQLNEVVRIQSCKPNSFISNENAVSIPHMHSFIHDLKARFKSNTIWIIIKKEPIKNDILLVEAILHTAVYFIPPEEIYIDEKTGMLAHKGSNKIIETCILELHQDELLDLPIDILRILLKMSDEGNCLNHLRSIFIAHDKRMLSVLSGYYEDILKWIISEDHINVLKECVIPTVIASEAFSTDFYKSSKAWSFLGGGSNGSIIYKPALSGKGNGILISHNFPSFSNFVEAILKTTNSISYETSAILQAFYKTSKTSVLVRLEENNWKYEDFNVVGTLLCMDNVFYGPGIFRAINSDIVALSLGGFSLPASVSIPNFPSITRFLIPSDILSGSYNPYINELRKNMRQKFAEYGVILATLDKCDDYWTSEQLQYFVEKIFGGVPMNHTPNNNDIVWDIKMIDNFDSHKDIARSHTLNSFDAHTDASWEISPPRCIALSINAVDRKGGGNTCQFPVKSVLQQLDSNTVSILKKIELDFEIPPEFDGIDKSKSLKLPLLIGENRIRYRSDIITESKLKEEEIKCLKKLKEVIANFELDDKHYCILPERYAIIFDNQTMIHSRTLIKDPRRHLKRIRFSLPGDISPQLDLALINHSNSVNSSLSLEDYSITNTPILPTKSNLPLYWSPSGQSGKNAKDEDLYSKLVGTNSNDNDRQRKLLANAIYSSGALHKEIICVNLFSYGNLYRSGEIIGELLRDCGSTNLPLGSLASDEAIKVLIENEDMGVNAIAGISSKLVFLAKHAQEGKLSLSKIKLVIFAGEALLPGQRKLIESVCHPDIQFLGLYGSAECGVFAFQSQKTLEKAKLFFDEPPTNIYEYTDDIVYIELSEDDTYSDEKIGSLIVTNFVRKPYLIRYNTGDLADIVSRECRLFRLYGRQKNSCNISVGGCWVYYNEIIENVMKPLGLEESTVQVWIDPIKDNNMIKLSLLVFSLDNQVDKDKLKDLFDIYVQNFITCKEIILTEILIADSENQFMRSKRSQKLLKFVDKRY